MVGLISWLPDEGRIWAVSMAFEVCAVRPVERLDDFFDAFMMMLAGTRSVLIDLTPLQKSCIQDIPIFLPLLGIGNLQHAIGSLGDAIQSIESVEVDGPARGNMLNSYEIVAKYHLGYGNTESLIHSIDGTGLENRSLAGPDSPLLAARNNSVKTLGV
jgi:hypothetical protein